MFWKQMITKVVENVDAKLQPKPRSIEQATPRSIACFLVGWQLYYRFIDHEVRKKLAVQKNSQKVYTDLLVNSQNSQSLVEKLLIAGGFLSSLYATYETKNKLWLIGGSLTLSIEVFDYFFVSNITKDLQKLDNSQKIKANQKLMIQNTQKRLNLIQNWKSKYAYKIAIGLVAILAFYIAQLNQSQKVNLKINVKK